MFLTFLTYKKLNFILSYTIESILLNTNSLEFKNSKDIQRIIMSYRRSYSVFGSCTETTSIDVSVNERTIFYITTGNVNELKKTLNKDNVNNVIESRSGYRALDFAIKNDNKEIIDLLLSLGADPYLYNGMRKNAFTMSRDHMSNHMTLNILDSKDAMIKDKNKTITTLEKSIADLEASKAYMLKSIDTLNANNSKFKKDASELKSESRNLKDEVSSLSVQTRSMTTKITQLEREATSLRTDNSVLRSSVSHLRIENDTLKKENTTLKRKYSELEESFDTLFQSTNRGKK